DASVPFERARHLGTVHVVNPCAFTLKRVNKPRCPEEESNLYVPCGTGGFKPPASAVPPPGPGPTTLRRRRGTGRERVEQCAADALRGRIAQAVRNHNAFDHVGEHVVERAAAQHYRDHRTAREPTDRARGSGAPRR